jgi:hypothetical protein
VTSASRPSASTTTSSGSRFGAGCSPFNAKTEPNE